MNETFTAHLRLPDPRVAMLDEAFLPLRRFAGPVERLHTGARRHRRFMAASPSLCALRLNPRGAA